MLIRTYADIESLKGKDALSAAEKKLIENCKRGEPTILGDGSLPQEPSAERTIRGGLLRYLILGGCDHCQVHEVGVLLGGAWIQGLLDLNFVKAKGALSFGHCCFEQVVSARQACFQVLVLTGSSLPGLDAAQSSVAGIVHLVGLRSRGPISFAGAEIGGQLACGSAELNGGEARALDAQASKIRGGVFLPLLKSHGEVSFVGATIRGQFLGDGAELNGDGALALNAQSAKINGGIFLRRLKSHGNISLSGAEISGQLSCKGAELHGGKAGALNAEGAKITSGVYLDEIRCYGECSFSGAEIGGSLSCDGAEFSGGEEGAALNAQGSMIKGSLSFTKLKSSGEIWLVGAEIGGQLSCAGADFDGNGSFALNGQRITIKEGLFWRDVKSVAGPVYLSAAQVGDLADDQASWNLVPDLSLVGMTYEDLAGPFDLAFRKRWLKHGAQFNGQFHPQPYQQLAKFYRESGHRYEAREILVAKEIEQRKATRKAIREGKARTESWLIPDALVFLNFLWDRTTRYIAGYGYKPWLSLWWLGGLVAIMMGLAQLTWNAGDFAPNSAVILTSPDWKAIADGSSENPAADWSGPAAPGKDYETFYAFAYALDVVVPVLDLGQTDAWAPSPARGDLGYRLFYLQKMFVVLGWVVTAIAAAAISGMIRRDD